MKTRQNYASELTKDYLIKLGFTNVTPDGYHVYFKGKELNQCLNRTKSKKNYLKVLVYDADKYNNTPKEERKCSSGNITFNVHVLNYVWNKGDRPEGFVVDHIDNNQLNNHIDNLQLLSQADNLSKERGESTRQSKCKLNKPLSFYENKLNMYLDQYEAAKKAHDADLCHKLRSNVANMKAKIRYYKDNINEAETLATENKAKIAKAAEKRKRANDIKLLNAYSKIFKSNGNLNKWHEVCRFIRYYDTYDHELINKFIDCVKKEADKAYEKELSNK